jgi:hypothetical protein
VTIAHGDDDVEEALLGVPGDVYLDSSDLEMTEDPGYGRPEQVVGLRFRSLTLPAGAIVEEAYVEFAADASNNEPTNLELTFEASDDARAFSAAPHDVTTRLRVTPAVAWPSVEAWTSGGRYRSPNLSAPLQAIACRPGFRSGSSVVVLIQGTGIREATAYDTSPAAAATLHVRYRF